MSLNTLWWRPLQGVVLSINYFSWDRCHLLLRLNRFTPLQSTWMYIWKKYELLNALSQCNLLFTSWWVEIIMMILNVLIMPTCPVKYNKAHDKGNTQYLSEFTIIHLGIFLNMIIELVWQFWRNSLYNEKKWSKIWVC